AFVSRYRHAGDGAGGHRAAVLYTAHVRSRARAGIAVFGRQDGTVIGADGDIGHRPLTGGDDRAFVGRHRHAGDGAGGHRAVVVADGHGRERARRGIAVFGSQDGTDIGADG